MRLLLIYPRILVEGHGNDKRLQWKSWKEKKKKKKKKEKEKKKRWYRKER